MRTKEVGNRPVFWIEPRYQPSLIGAMVIKDLTDLCFGTTEEFSTLGFYREAVTAQSPGLLQPWVGTLP